MSQPEGEPSRGRGPRRLLDLAGATPVVELRSFVDDSRGRLLAKLESFNPSGSKHDRVARQVIEDARAEGRLARCQTVVGAFDGPQSLAFAEVCALLRHPLLVVMSEEEAERFGPTLTALGAEVVPVAARGAAGRAGLAREVAQLVAVTGGFDPDLLNNPSAFRAHRLGTGPEILHQLRGQFGVFVDFAATGATLGGCAAAFYEEDPTIRCYAAEPAGAAALSGEEVVEPDHGIEGGGFGLAELPLLARELLAGVVQVTRAEALDAARTLARMEGIVAGLSTGANLAAALKLLEGECFGETIVVLVHGRCDRGGAFEADDVGRSARGAA